MRTTATLLLMTALGCGGAGEKTDTTTPSVDSRPEATPLAATETPAPAPADMTPAPAPAEAAPAPEVAPPAPEAARAEVKMLKGEKSLGTMTFERTGNVITINGQFSGLKKGQHALFIHMKGDCSDNGRKVGEHLNPTKSKHGPPASPTRHAGDFGDLTFDKDGNATFSMETDSITLAADRPDGVIGRAVVIHSRKDSKSGNAGSPLACGVVMLDDGVAPGGSAPETSAAPAAAAPATATKASVTK